jgi:hypothetical protein
MSKTQRGGLHICTKINFLHSKRGQQPCSQMIDEDKSVWCLQTLSLILTGRKLSHQKSLLHRPP